jgi:hypothetical protein
VRSLLETALALAEEPERWFGGLVLGSRRRAYAFAFSCELGALGSLGLFLLALLALTLPRLAGGFLRSPLSVAVALVALALATLGMVWLHRLWGRLLEAGIKSAGGEADAALGETFGLYACGWDLVTSPLGLLAALALRGPRGLGTLGSGARAPGRALDAYYGVRRGLDGATRAVAARATGRLVTRRLGAAVGVVLLIVVLWTAGASL